MTTEAEMPSTEAEVLSAIDDVDYDPNTEGENISRWAVDADFEADFDRFEIGKRIVAEGDSWFNLPFEGDILDHLDDFLPSYRVWKFAHHGDELLDMTYGTACSKSLQRLTTSFTMSIFEAARKQQRTSKVCR